MNPDQIAEILAWEGLDSRGNPTVGCRVTLAGGAEGRALAPAGASTGTHEARELRDGAAPFRGRGVQQAVQGVTTEIRSALLGAEVGDQRQIDATLRSLDGTPNLSRLGANAVLAVSLATRLAAAAEAREPLWRHALGADGRVILPMPMVNIISGGAHAARSIDIQDVLVIPVGASSFPEAIEWVDRVRSATADELAARGIASGLVADEGGFGPPLPGNEAAIEIVTRGIERAGLSLRDEVGIAVDVAATQFHDAMTGTYLLAADDRRLTADEWGGQLVDWTRRYPIISIEDAMAEDDWYGWGAVSHELRDHVQLIGDDLFVTNPERLERGIEAGIGNAVLVKPNQIGTVTSAADIVAQAARSDYATVLSARSGETEDTWLADLAVGWSTGQIKVGSLTRSERTAKWNRLLELAAELGATADFAGREALVLGSPVCSDSALGPRASL